MPEAPVCAGCPTCRPPAVGVPVVSPAGVPSWMEDWFIAPPPPAGGSRPGQTLRSVTQPAEPPVPGPPAVCSAPVPEPPPVAAAGGAVGGGRGAAFLLLPSVVEELWLGEAAAATTSRRSGSSRRGRIKNKSGGGAAPASLARLEQSYLDGGGRLGRRSPNLADSLPQTGSLIHRALGVGLSPPAPGGGLSPPAAGGGLSPPPPSVGLWSMDMDQMMDTPLQPAAGGGQPYSVGVPIPGRQQWQYSGPEFTQMRSGRMEPELGTSAGAATSYPPSTDYGSSPSPGWPGALHEPELSRNLAGIQIEDFDLEDVDVADLISGQMREPTLTELNAGDDLTDLSLDFAGAGNPFGSPAPPLVKTEMLDTPIKNEWPPFSSSIPASFAPQARPPLVGQHDPMLPSFPSGGGVAEPRRPAGTSGGRLTLQSLLAQPSAVPRAGGQAGRLSSSVPCESQLEQRAAARLGPTAAVGRMDELRGSSSSVSTGVLSPGSHGSYVDEGAESPYEHYSDSDSDAGSTVGDEGCLSSSLGNRKERFFWQYNVQAKGPKGQRIQLTEDLSDPHHISQAIDPVFSSTIKMEGIKHSGKARRGDGNDLTPSPRKLLHIQRDLDKLNRLINDMTPVSELPFNVRPKSRKEKNKLASRACRLKKKAQHEANKIQAFGLGEEHRRLSSALKDMQEALKGRLLPPADGGPAPSQEETGQLVERVIKQAHKHRVAGHLPEYVERTLERYRTGSSAQGGPEQALAHTELG